ncbi:MAG TPA: 2Fe-2S iron-sulfur cluster-binding protein [Chroococcales cyanobacterium]
MKKRPGSQSQPQEGAPRKEQANLTAREQEISSSKDTQYPSDTSEDSLECSQSQDQSQSQSQNQVQAQGQTRREFLANAAAVSVGVGITNELANSGKAQAAEATTKSPAVAGTVMRAAAPAETIAIELNVNGETRSVTIDPRASLLDTLRENLDLTGSKKGCDHGQCGACTVIVDGKRINSCLTFAVMYQGKQITTIEGLGREDDLHPMQAAFIKHDGFQCGYCTPGQICSAVAMLEEYKGGAISCVSDDITNCAARPALDLTEIKERMSGNLCRCGAYAGIVEAIKEVSGKSS